MSNKFIKSNSLVELSTEEQQLLSGGQTTGNPPYGGQPSDGGQPMLGGESPIGEQPSMPSSGYGLRRYPTYICQPSYGYEGSGSSDD